MEKGEKEWSNWIAELLRTVNSDKVAKLLLAFNDVLLRMDFPFSPLELQMACNQLILIHLEQAQGRGIPLS